MPKETDRFKPFEVCIGKIVTRNIKEAENEINRLIEEADSVEELHMAIIECNSHISLLCGDDEELYQEWKFRLFLLPSGKYTVIQGLEIDTDYSPESFVPPDDE